MTDFRKLWYNSELHVVVMIFLEAKASQDDSATLNNEISSQNIIILIFKIVNLLYKTDRLQYITNSSNSGTYVETVQQKKIKWT